MSPFLIFKFDTNMKSLHYLSLFFILLKPFSTVGMQPNQDSSMQDKLQDIGAVFAFFASQKHLEAPTQNAGTPCPAGPEAQDTSTVPLKVSKIVPVLPPLNHLKAALATPVPATVKQPTVLSSRYRPIAPAPYPGARQLVSLRHAQKPAAKAPAAKRRRVYPKPIPHTGVFSLSKPDEQVIFKPAK